MSQNWSVFHFTRQSQVNNLTKDEVRSLLEKYTPADLPHLYLWNESLDDWKPLKNFPDLMICLLERLFKDAEKAPPPLPLDLLVKMTPEELPGPLTTMMPRKHPRHLIKLKTLIRCKDSVFRTFTTTVSAEGFGLAHEIPAEFLKEACYGVITSANGIENVRFDMTPVCKNAARVMNRSERLQAWIQFHLQNSPKNGTSFKKGLAQERKHRLAVP